MRYVNITTIVCLSKVIDLGVNGKPIYNFLLVINCNISATVFEIFTLKDRQESPAVADKPARRGVICLYPPIGGTPSNINEIYASMKVHLVGYNSIADSTGLSPFV